MGKHKMIAKSCPKCELQVAVASKSCKCGHTFFAARRGADCLPAVEDIRRRTGRVRRSQPQFYDAQHYQKQIKRRSPKKRSLSRSMDEDTKPKDKNESGKFSKCTLCSYTVESTSQTCNHLFSMGIKVLLNESR